MKKIFKWLAWGIGGLIAAAVLLNAWSGKNDTVKLVLTAACFIGYGFYLISKALDDIQKRQTAQTDLLYRIIDNMDRNAITPHTQEMLYDFLYANTERVRLDVHKP